MKDKELFTSKIKERDGNKCVICGSFIRLHIHHILKRENGGDESYKNLVTVCEDCHHKIHSEIETTFSFENYVYNFEEPKEWVELVKNSGYLTKSYRLSNDIIKLIDKAKRKENISYNLLFRKVFEDYGVE